jgi:hypothetical protein
MALGIADHIWTVGELIDNAELPPEMAEPLPSAPPPSHKPFTVIQGGLS